MPQKRHLSNCLVNTLAENLREGKKSIDIQNKRAHNLETLKGIHKKNATLLETSLLKNYGKLSSLLGEFISRK